MSDVSKFIKKSIHKNIYSVGNSIDSTIKLSIKLKISKYKVKNQLNELINIGIIEKFNNRYFIISNNFSKSSKDTINRLFLKSKINLLFYNIKQKGGIIDSKYLAGMIVKNKHITIIRPYHDVMEQFYIHQLNSVNEITREIYNRNKNKFEGLKNV